MKIKLFNLSGAANRETGADHASQDLDIPTAKALFETAKILACPDTKSVQGTRGCLSCPYFEGVGYVQINGEAPVENRFRVMCACPRLRPLATAATQKTESYKSELKHNSKSLSAHENAVFIDGNVSINCPLSRAKNGVWRVDNPPCTACFYYKGLTIGPKGEMIVACAHTNTIRITKSVHGSMDIVQRIENGSSK